MGKKNTNRRPQSTKPPKSGNTPYIEAMMGKRGSNAAGPHKSINDYQRKPKHFKGWE